MEPVRGLKRPVHRPGATLTRTERLGHHRILSAPEVVASVVPARGLLRVVHGR